MFFFFKFYIWLITTSWSVIASAAFGLFPSPSFLSSLLRAAKPSLLSSTTLQGYFQAFMCRLKLQMSPLKLEGSKCSPSFLLTATINSLVYSLKGLGHAILGNFSTDQMVIELTKT